MDRHSILNLNIRTYRNLKDQSAMILLRLAELNRKIKAEIVALIDEDGYVPDHINYYGAKGFQAKVQVKKQRPQVDQYALEDLLHKKGLWETCKKEVVDEDMVETLFINGILTDADMRSIIAEPSKPQLALTVERVDDEDV